MNELSPKQVKELPTAALKLIQDDLRRRLVPDAVKQAQAFQRSLVWVDRELKKRVRDHATCQRS